MEAEASRAEQRPFKIPNRARRCSCWAQGASELYGLCRRVWRLPFSFLEFQLTWFCVSECPARKKIYQMHPCCQRRQSRRSANGGNFSNPNLDVYELSYGGNL